MDSDLTDQRRSSPSNRRDKSRYIPAEILFLISVVFFTVMNLIYESNKSDFDSSTGNALYPDVTLFLLIAGALFLVSSVISLLSAESGKPVKADGQSRVSKSTVAVVADSLSENKKVVAVSAIIYGIIFAFLDGIMIFQPTVNFKIAYGITGPATVVENCCGPPGYIPVGLAYFPSQHFGIQLIPLSLMILVLMSTLVGVNVSLLIASVRTSKSNLGQQVRTSVKSSSFFGGAFGALLGVFAGCPTCAAAFFLSMIAGSGATAFSLAISAYQPLIILASVPLLIGSILWQARSIRKILLGCPI
jgi:hypothetical protein